MKKNNEILVGKYDTEPSCKVNVAQGISEKGISREWEGCGCVHRGESRELKMMVAHHEVSNSQI